MSLQISFRLIRITSVRHYREAIEFIQQESNIHQSQNHILFHQIHDAKVQAILLGKLATASEKKIDFHIEGDSALHPLPDHIKFHTLLRSLET